MRQIPRSLGIFVLVSVAGCGNGDRAPTGSNAGPQALQVLDGRTGSPIPSLSGLQAVDGQPLNLNVAGFLTLTTVYRGVPILLWPNDTALPVATTRALAYQDKNPGVLVRWPDGTGHLNLVLDETLRSTPWAVTRIENAAAVVSRAHPAMDIGVGGAGPSVAVGYNPNDKGFETHPNAAMVAYVRYSDAGVVQQAHIVVRSLDIDGFWYGEPNFQTAMAHEIIHATGLVGHLSPDVKGTMSATADSYGFPEPTPVEVLIMKLQYARRVGTTLTGEIENEGGRVTTSSAEGKWHLVCAR